MNGCMSPARRSPELFKTATSKAGEHLDLAPLGTLVPDAPAGLIAVRGNPFKNFKPLEYPDLVISGGRVVVNKFKANTTPPPHRGRGTFIFQSGARRGIYPGAPLNFTAALRVEF